MTKLPALLLIFLASGQVHAIIPPAQTVLILKGHEPIKEASILSLDQTKKLIPQDMVPTEDQGAVARNIMGRGAQYILDSPSVKNNQTVQQAQAAAKVMNTSVTIGDPKAPGIHHSFDSQADLVMGVGKFHYSGFFSANFTYHADGNFEMSVDRKLDTVRTLVVKHTSNDGVSSAQISWNW